MYQVVVVEEEEEEEEEDPEPGVAAAYSVKGVVYALPPVAGEAVRAPPKGGERTKNTAPRPGVTGVDPVGAVLSPTVYTRAVAKGGMEPGVGRPSQLLLLLLVVVVVALHTHPAPTLKPPSVAV